MWAIRHWLVHLLFGAMVVLAASRAQSSTPNAGLAQLRLVAECRFDSDQLLLRALVENPGDASLTVELGYEMGPQRNLLLYDFRATISSPKLTKPLEHRYNDPRYPAIIGMDVRWSTVIGPGARFVVERPARNFGLRGEVDGSQAGEPVQLKLALLVREAGPYAHAAESSDSPPRAARFLESAAIRVPQDCRRPTR